MEAVLDCQAGGVNRDRGLHELPVQRLGRPLPENDERFNRRVPTMGMQLNISPVADRLFVNTKTTIRYFLQSCRNISQAYFPILQVRTALTAFIKSRDGHTGITILVIFRKK